MITWSPVSTCGAKIGLCLPRRTRATSVATRPSTRPSASTTCHARLMSLGLGVNVGTRVPSVLGSRLLAGRGCAPGRPTMLWAGRPGRQTAPVVGQALEDRDDGLDRGQVVGIE